MVEGVGPLGRIQQVRGIAERDLRHRRGLVDDGIDGGTHLLHVVQGIEDAEDVHPGLGRLRDESPGHLRRVGGVADGVAAAQQHLQILVRHRGPELGQPLPWVLAEEPQRDVIGGATPALDGKQAGQQPRLPRGHRHQVSGAHARRQQRLVGVAECGVGHSHRLLLAQGPGEPGRTESEQLLPGTVWDLACRQPRGQFCGRFQGGGGRAVRLVDGDAGEEPCQLGTPVGRDAARQQVGSLVDERRGDHALLKVWVLQDGSQE